MRKTISKIIRKKFECDSNLINKLKLEEKKLDDEALAGVVGGAKHVQATKRNSCIRAC